MRFADNNGVTIPMCQNSCLDQSKCMTTGCEPIRRLTPKADSITALNMAPVSKARKSRVLRTQCVAPANTIILQGLRQHSVFSVQHPTHLFAHLNAISRKYLLR